MPFGPGKTAPRLIEDLLHYDPRLQAQFGRNILTDPPPHFDPDGKHVRPFPKSSCRHFFTIKYSQSKLPVDGKEWGTPTIYKVSAICSHCRFHLDILVDYHRSSGKRKIACPCLEYPVHHFVHKKSDVQEEGTDLSNISVPYRFECSAPNCPVGIWVYLRPPRLSEKDIYTLTDSELLQQRLENAIREEPNRPDLKVARPVDGLSYLNIYIRDSLKPTSGKDRIPIRNKKFTTTFGRDCDEIFQRLGFVLEESTELEFDTSWLLPKPSMEENPLGGESLRKVLEDTREELFALINSLPPTERNSAREMTYQPIPAIKDIETILGALDYEKAPSARTIDLTKPEHPYYAGLGALSTFSDGLLWYSYERQVESDHSNLPYYFECIQDLVKGRKSETLEIEIAMLASQGYLSRSDFRKAYAYFGIKPAQAEQLTDQEIIGQFQSRLGDTSPKMEAEMREMLRRIGQDRRSDVIIQHASNVMETYAQALSYLGADEATSDDWITTMHTTKVVEAETNKSMADKAVEIIANHRNSEGLRFFLRTGQTSMDLGEAYRILDIQDRSQKPDRGVLETYLSERLREQPHREAELQQAYALICKQEFGTSDGPEGSEDAQNRPLDKWPVGLQNIGNTCYLNSLLQFLFTITPFRQLVLDCDRYLMELTEENIRQKRVGSEDITEERIIRAQLFIRELGKLFTNLITAPTRTIVPDVQLAILAIEKPKNTDQIEDSTDLQDASDGLGEIGGKPILGPLPPPPINLQNTSHFFEDSDSDTTLADSERTLEGDTPMINVKVEDDAQDKPELHAETKTLPSQSNEKSDTENSTPHEHKNDVKISDTTSVPPPPSRPPPVPPRPKQPLRVSQIGGKIEFSGLQQDLNEIMENILYQIEYAIRPTEIVDGEQYDQIKELFFGETITTLLKAEGPNRTTDLWNAINVGLGFGGCHIYSALDNEFDMDSNELDGASVPRYEVIKRAPPVLRINIRRVTYGIDGARSQKVEHPLYLDDVIYLDRYLQSTETHTEQDLMDRRQQSWKFKKQLRALRKKKQVLSESELGAPLPDVLETASDAVEKFQTQILDESGPSAEATVSLSEKLKLEADELRGQIDRIDAKIKELENHVDGMFSDLKAEPYRLHAVFIHKGGTRGGHYYVYIHDEEGGIWRRYNETVVSEVNPTEEEELFPKPGSNASGYSTGVIYVKADPNDLTTHQLTQALFRFPDIPQNDREALQEVQDIEMSDNLDERRTLQVINGIDPT